MFLIQRVPIAETTPMPSYANITIAGTVLLPQHNALFRQSITQIISIDLKQHVGSANAVTVDIVIPEKKATNIVKKAD